MHHLRITMDETIDSVLSPNGRTPIEERLYAAAQRFLDRCPERLACAVDADWTNALCLQVQTKLQDSLSEMLSEVPIRDNEGMPQEGAIEIDPLLGNDGSITGRMRIGRHWHKRWSIRIERIDDGARQKRHELTMNLLPEESST